MQYMKTYLIGFILLLAIQETNAQNFWKRSIRGEGPVVTRDVELTSFSGVSSGFSANVYLTQGDEQKVTLHGQANILDNLRLDVKGSVLKIRYDRMVRRAEPVEIYITLPHLDLVRLSGSGNIKTETDFSRLGDLEVQVSGSGGMHLDIDAQEVYGKVSGSGRINLAGQADAMTLSISGSGNLNALDLDLQHCDASISGSGNVKVSVNQSLVASVSGSGNIRYRGKGVRIDSKVSGSGSVRSL